MLLLLLLSLIHHLLLLDFGMLRDRLGSNWSLIIVCGWASSSDCAGRGFSALEDGLEMFFTCLFLDAPDILNRQLFA